MADIYVRSTDGDNADDGSTWALAKLDLSGADDVENAGDTVWVSQNHAESSASALFLNWDGTKASPTRIICGNDAAEPPTALATTATVTTTGNSSIGLVTGGDHLYLYGIGFTAGSGATGTANFTIASGTGSFTVFEDCSIHLGTTDTATRIIISGTTNATVLKNTDLQFSSTSQSINTQAEGFRWIGGSVLSDAAITKLFDNVGGTIVVEGVDLSNCASSMNICSSTSSSVRLTVRNCKLPSSWSGSVNASTPAIDSSYELVNCDDGDTNYRLEKKTYFGTVVHETTIVKDSGASDGTTQLSWNMTSNADTEWNHQTLVSPPIILWNEDIDNTITVAVDILHDSVTALQDDEVWIEVQYLGTSGFPLSLFADDAAADYLATPANQATSGATWTTTGMSNPNEQQLSVDITPREKGYIIAKVHLAKPSYTIYVDPLLLIS